MDSAQPPVALSQGESRCLRAVLDQLLPRTAGPSASDLGVPAAVEAAARSSPPFAALLRAGLTALDRMAEGHGYASADPARRRDILRAIQLGDVRTEDWPDARPQAFFAQLRAHAVEAYYSHPGSWPAAGYPGPSLPMGYPDGGPCGSAMAGATQ